MELAVKVLAYLDAESLFAAAQVSNVWRRRIDASAHLWRSISRQLGGRKRIPPNSNAKAVAKAAYELRSRIKAGKAFGISKLSGIGIPQSPAYFVALDTNKGYVAAVTADNPDANQIADRVVVYAVRRNHCERNSVLHDFAIPLNASRATTIKLLFPFHVCVGHSDGRVNTWNLPTAASLEMDTNQTHAASVFALDGDLDSDLLVSGAADYTVKLWRLTTGVLLRTIRSHDHWVVSVRLVRGKATLLTLSKNEIHVFNDVTKSSSKNVPDLAIPLKSEGCFHELRDLFFTPGMHVSETSKITFVRQMPLFETQTIGDADIVTVDMASGRLCRSVHINQKIRKLLAVGERFALVLLPYVDAKYKNLAIIDLEERRLIGGCTVPHSRASTPDFSQICIGDEDWLNGLSEEATRNGDLMAALATQDGAITLIDWVTP